LIRSQAVILEFKFIVSNIKNDGTKVFANFLIKHSLYCSFTAPSDPKLLEELERMVL